MARDLFAQNGEGGAVMKTLQYWTVAWAASCLALGCAASPTPTARAVQVEQLQCDESTSAPEDARILATTKVISAEPLYSNVPTSYNDIEHRVNGAKLLVRTPEGVSAERMTRILQCHSARQLLGQPERAELTKDPYWLPGAWIDIRVTPEDGNDAVTLEADTITKGLQVYARAAAYADAHPFELSPVNR
jgi:hypothetical protein